MAFSTEIAHLICSTATVHHKGPEVIQYFAASTNQHDQGIALTICLTVIGVCLLVCLSVFGCFIVVSRIKRHTKEKDHLVEIKKLEINEELLDLREYKKRKSVEENKEKKNEESRVAEQNYMTLIEKVKKLMETGSDVKISLKSGSESIEVTSLNPGCLVKDNQES